MQQAVDHQKKDLLIDRKVSLNRIGPGPIGGYHDIPQHIRVHAAAFTLLKRKRNNIGRLVFAQVLPVDPLNGRIIDKRDADFLIRAVDQAQEPGHLDADLAFLDFNSFLPVFDLYFHGPLSCRLFP